MSRRQLIIGGFLLAVSAAAALLIHLGEVTMEIHPQIARIVVPTGFRKEDTSVSIATRIPAHGHVEIHIAPRDRLGCIHLEVMSSTYEEVYSGGLLSTSMLDSSALRTPGLYYFRFRGDCSTDGELFEASDTVSVVVTKGRVETLWSIIRTVVLLFLSALLIIGIFNYAPVLRRIVLRIIPNERVRQFVKESLILLALVLLIWFTSVSSELGVKSVLERGMTLRGLVFFFVRTYLPKLVAWGTLTEFVAVIVFYGTSYQVTPLSPLKALRRWTATPTSDPTIPAPKEIVTAIGAPEVTANPDGNYPPLQPGVAARQDENVTDIVRSLAKDADQLADRMERRMNTYLILALAVGFVGLAIWWWSFPQTEVEPDKLLFGTIMRFVPRFTILVFIELLAGFFLRQYRIGVEDFKYFLDLKRQADSNLLLYILVDRQKDTDMVRKFVDMLLGHKLNEKVQSGESTVNVMKEAENPSARAIDSVVNSVKEIVASVATTGRGVK